MKTYKIRSLLFFLSFATAAFVYNKVEQQEKFQEKIASNEVVDMQPQDLHEDNDSKDLDTPLQ